MAWWDQVGQSLAAPTSWLQTPQGQAAQLQFGLSMLSPQPRGQGFLSTLASSIGQGAEASGRTRTIEQTEAEKRRQAEEDLRKESRAERALGFEERKITAEEKDTASKIAERKALPGGLTAAMLNAQNRGTDYATDLALKLMESSALSKNPMTWEDAYAKASGLYSTRGQATGGPAASPGAQGGAPATPSGAPPAPFEGQIRTSRTTGAKQRFTKGQWVPM